MAMVIANNNAAMLTLGEINKNNSALGKQLKKVSSGMKINSAGDDASCYAISERMRVQLRSLDQDIRNTQTGSSLLRVADGAVANIIEELRSLKELALNAANDTNTDLDRATIHKEFEHRKANINDIAAETNYNGKILLDGRYKQKVLVERDIITTQTEYNLPTIIDIPNGDYTVSASGIYRLNAGYSGNILVKADNVTLMSDGTELNEVHIYSNQDVNDLYIKNLNIHNTIRPSTALSFRAPNSKLHLLGTNTLSSGVWNLRTDDAPICTSDNSNLSIVGTGTLNINTNAAQEITTALIYGGENSTITLDCGTTVNISTKGELIWPLIAAKNGNLIINGQSSDCHASLNITISNGSRLSGPILGGAGLINNSVTVYAYADVNLSAGTRNSITSAPIGYTVGGEHETTVDGTKKKVTVYSEANLNITYNNRSVQYAIGNDTRLNAYDNGTMDVITYRGIHGTNAYNIGNNNPEPAAEVRWTNNNSYNAKTNGYLDATDPTTGISTQIFHTRTTVTEVGNPLVIHHGTKANEALNVYLEDMHTWALKDEIPSDDDILELARMDTKKAAAYKAMLDEAKDMTLDDAKVTTQHDANVSLRVIDGALNYALEQATHIGAYMSRLDFTEANLVTANESTQASESTIRDADMAKEMAEYTKANVLLQASQSMLAQANQNSSQVISLLQ